VNVWTRFTSLSCENKKLMSSRKRGREIRAPGRCAGVTNTTVLARVDVERGSASRGRRSDPLVRLGL
ncbi:MAG: hypothetical protein ACOC8K_07755, partial [Gemmatimonadota bacterium]